MDQRICQFNMCFSTDCNLTTVGAILSCGFSHAIQSSLNTWKSTFLVIGLMNPLWSLSSLLFCLNIRITTAHCLNKKKKLLISREFLRI